MSKSCFYFTERIIAMSFPSKGVMALYRNPVRVGINSYIQNVCQCPHNVQVKFSSVEFYVSYCTNIIIKSNFTSVLMYYCLIKQDNLVDKI